MPPWIPAAAAAVVVVVGVLGLLAVRRRFVVVTVVGGSMQPTYRPGDRVLVRRRLGQRVAAGSVIVLTEPPATGWTMMASSTTGRATGGAARWIIKRVAALPGEAVPELVRPAVAGVTTVPPDSLVVLGDHNRSGDSRHWGFAPIDQVLGSVIRRLPSGTAQ